MNNYIISYSNERGQYIGVFIISTEDRISAINEFDHARPGARILSIINGTRGRVEYSDGSTLTTIGNIYNAN